MELPKWLNCRLQGYEDLNGVDVLQNAYPVCIYCIIKSIGNLDTVLSGIQSFSKTDFTTGAQTP